MRVSDLKNDKLVSRWFSGKRLSPETRDIGEEYQK